MKFRTLLLSMLIAAFFTSAAFAVDFTDAEGRFVSIDNPRRVVSLYNSYGDAWILSGGSLAGTISDDGTDSSAVNLGSHLSPNMELLFSLDPDFVLLASNVSSHAEIGALLEQAGIPCAYFNTPDWQGYMETVRLFTEITGREDLYLAQVKAVQEPVETLIAAAQQHTDHFGSTTALLLRADSRKVKAKGSELTVAGRILQDMGFINLADGDSPLAEHLSMEAILMQDPDWIFVYLAGSDTDAARASLENTLTGNPAWSSLTAVREGRCIILDRDLFHFHPNERWAESYAFIAELLEGERLQ